MTPLEVATLGICLAAVFWAYKQSVRYIKAKRLHVLKGDKKIKAAQSIKPFNYQKSKKKTTVDFYKEYYKKKYKNSKTFLVIMLLRGNTKYDMFTVATSENKFIHKGKGYMIDQDMATEDVATKLPTLLYHQEVSVPIKLNLKVDDLIKSMEKSKDIDDSVKLALNPGSLKEFISSEIIEKILKGAELTDQMRKMMLFLVINMIMTGICAILLAKSQGII